MNHGIRLIVFDLGGVLVRICRSWQEGCAAAGLELRANGAQGTQAWFAPGETGHLYQTGAISCEEFAARLSHDFRQTYSAEEIMRVHHAWLLGEYEGVGELIEEIHQRDVGTAALSNTNHAHWLRLVEMPAVARLRHRLASHELRLHKPDPAIYRELEQRLDVSGGDIIFFDDLPDNVEAANKLGWNAVLIDPHGKTDQQMRHALRDRGVLG